MRGGRPCGHGRSRSSHAAGLGFLAGRFGLALPMTEPMVLASVLVLGLIVAASRPVGLGAGDRIGRLYSAPSTAWRMRAKPARNPRQPSPPAFMIASAVLHCAGPRPSPPRRQRLARLAVAATALGRRRFGARMIPGQVFTLAGEITLMRAATP
jgi:hypothetical protein